MITQSYPLDMIPSGEPIVVHASQYDRKARVLEFALYSGGVAFDVPVGATATIDGTKPDGTAFMYQMDVDGDTVSIEIEEQMTVLAGDIPCEVRITSGTGILGSANFILQIEPAAIDESAISDTDIPLFQQLADDAAASASDAALSADDAAASAASISALIPSGGSTGQYLSKTSNGTAWATVEEIPAGGTTGQVLAKASGTDYDTEWQTVSSGGGGAEDLAVTITLSGGIYSADHTFAEITQNIADGGTPYVIYSITRYTLTYEGSAMLTFTCPLKGGTIQYFRISSADAVTFGLDLNTVMLQATLTAANWVGNVYTITDASILSSAVQNITLTLPDVSTEALKEAQIAEFEAYDLYAFNQQVGSVDIYARGDVPTSDITVLLILSKA